MKVASRVALGYGVLLGLMAALLVYPLLTIQKMQSFTRRSSGESLRMAVDTLELMRDRDILEDLVRKHLAAPSPDLQAQLKAEQESFEDKLAALQAGLAAGKQQTEASRLSQFWRELAGTLAGTLPRLGGSGPAASPATPVQFPVELEEQFDRLRAQSQTLYQATVSAITAEGALVGKAGERAAFILLVSVASGLVLGLLCSILIIRSVAVPLRQLAQGTRALAEGKSFYRLDTSRNDEFSQIARDFNELTRR